MATINIPGFKQYNTNPNARAVDELDLTEALNVYWSGNGVAVRDGSSLWKNTAQTNWGRIARAVTFKRRDDNYFFVVVAMTSGRVFYIKSNTVNFGTPSVTWTEINSPSSTTPALAASARKYSMYSFNNLLFFADSSNGYYSWNGTDANLTARTDPPSLSTANIIDFEVKSNRLVALDDAGKTHLSAVNDGTDFTTISGGGIMNYGRVEGLIATNVISFNDDLIITTEDITSIKYQGYRLTGIQFYDFTLVGSDTGQFEVKKINIAASIIGESGQEIPGDTIGLSRHGFVSLLSIIDKETITERDYISYPIKELVANINFAKVDKISSITDINGKYYCAVPFGDDATEANVIFCYDYKRSSPSENIYRWSLLTFDSFVEIATMFVAQGQAYAVDTSGNIYKLNDEDMAFIDEDSNGDQVAINVIVRTAAIGGKEPGIEKDFKDITFLLTNLYEELDLGVNIIIDSRFIAEDIDGSPFAPIKVELPEGGLLYDTPGLLYDDFKSYDSSGVNQRLVTLVNRGGRANSIQWQFSTNSLGVSWGLSSLSIDVEAVEASNESGTNNSGET